MKILLDNAQQAENSDNHYTNIDIFQTRNFIMCENNSQTGIEYIQCTWQHCKMCQNYPMSVHENEFIRGNCSYPLDASLSLPLSVFR